MGLKDLERRRASQNVNYWAKIPKVGTKGVSVAHSLSPSEGDNNKLERKKSWCVQADRSLKNPWRPKNEQEQEQEQ